MSKLLYANFFRLWRNRLFQIGLGFMFFAGGFLVFQQYRQLVGYGTNVKLDSTMFGYTIMIGVISSIFCSLFVNIVASFLLCFSYILANIVIGVPLIGTLETPLPKVLLILAGSLLTVIAFCSVFTMISLLIQSKAIAPVVCIVAMFLSIAFFNEVQRILDQPEFWYDGTVNTAYVDGTEREVLEFLYNAIPAGQEMQYSRRSTENIGEMAAYAAGLTVITTGIGAFFFNRKDIR